MPWSRSRWSFPRTIQHFIGSLPWRCQACIQTHAANHWMSFWVAAVKFLQNGPACHIIFFTMIFRVSLNAALCSLIIFTSIIWCGICSCLTLHINIAWCFSLLRSDVFSKCSLNFFKPVYFFLFAVIFPCMDHLSAPCLHLLPCVWSLSGLNSRF